MIIIFVMQPDRRTSSGMCAGINTCMPQQNRAAAHVPVVHACARMRKVVPAIASYTPQRGLCCKWWSHCPAGHNHWCPSKERGRPRPVPCCGMLHTQWMRHTQPRVPVCKQEQRMWHASSLQWRMIMHLVACGHMLPRTQPSASSS